MHLHHARRIPNKEQSPSFEMFKLGILHIHHIVIGFVENDAFENAPPNITKIAF